MSFADHKLIDNSLGDTMLDLLKEKRKGSFKIYGNTFVNLLGKYGNFEADSNSDGLADGWIKDTALTAVTNTIYTVYGMDGLQSQKIALAASGEGGNYTEIDVVAGQKLLISGYFKRGSTSTTIKLIVDWRDDSDVQISTETIFTIIDSGWQNKLASVTVPTSAVKARIYITVSGVAGKYGYFDCIRVINLTTQGKLDPVRQAKYGVTNWTDLTEVQLEDEIPYYDSVISVNVEDGTASELVINNHKNAVLGRICSSISIPDTCELHGIGGYHDYVEYDADEEKLLYVSFIAREDKTTDGSGDFALTGVVSGSNVLVRNKTTGAVEWCTESEGSVHTSTIAGDVEIWYIRSTPTSTNIYGFHSGDFLTALRNFLEIDSKLPVAMEINGLNQSGWLITQRFYEII